MAFHLVNAMTPRRALSETYMLPDIFRYSITATRDIVRRARRKNVINIGSLDRDIRSVHARASMVAVHAYKSACTLIYVLYPRLYRLVRTSILAVLYRDERIHLGMPSVRSIDKESYRNIRPESRIQIELISMETLETRKLLFELTVKSFNAAVPS